jgi:formylglycine-generating enzyme required for sulfatase activity
MVWIQGGKGDWGGSVKSFWINKYETTWATWKKVCTWSSSKGYDIENAPSPLYSPYDQLNRIDTNPVYGITWYEAVKWCNAKSEMEGLSPVYTVNGSVYRQGESVPEIIMNANGYKLPSDLEWKFAAKGGGNQKDMLIVVATKLTM